MARAKVMSISLVALAWVSLVPRAWAQQPLPGIAGVIRNQAGMPVVGVAVKAASPTLIENVRLMAVAAPRSDGPTPISDPSVGDGGVSAFYVWDKRVPGTAGKLLRQEPLVSELMLANASRGLRVLYTSTNGIDNKKAITVSGAIYFPKGTAPSGGWAIVAWAHGTTGLADVCAPSWTPRSSRDADYLNAWLAQGYAIVATDYQGLGTPGGHPWNMVRPEAYSVLDSVRAALTAFPELSNSVVIVGQSQGAHAALSASLLTNEYAPGVHLKGTVATGVPGAPPYAPQTKAPQIPNPSRGGGDFPAFNLMNLLAYRTIDPSLNPSDYLTDAARPAFEVARTACFTDVAQATTKDELTVDNEFKKSVGGAAAKAAAYKQYPSTKFVDPVFIGAGLADTTTFPEDQYNMVVAACYAGSRVEAHYYPGKDHNSTVNASVADSVPFVKKVFAGQPIPGNCSSVKPPPARN
jgi:pimeloyl-ACP methyl ester carboxylesterase